MNYEFDTRRVRGYEIKIPLTMLKSREPVLNNRVSRHVVSLRTNYLFIRNILSLINKRRRKKKRNIRNCEHFEHRIRSREICVHQKTSKMVIKFYEKSFLNDELTRFYQFTS